MSEGTPVNLLDDGVLWLINRTVFHPRGYALAYGPETGEFTLYGDGSEAWYYRSIKDDPEHGVDEDAKLRAVNDLLHRAAERNRQ